MRPSLPWLCVLAGCPALGERDITALTDADGDGVISSAFGGADCDDQDRRVHPGAPEICDGLDNDCDTLLNEDDDDAVGVDWYRDADRDGFGNPDILVRTCLAYGDLPDSPWVAVDADDTFDCDDTDPDQHPGQEWRVDGDGDGFGSSNGDPRAQCERPKGFVVAVAKLDCRDFDAASFPGADEVCNGYDDDCDGLVDDDDLSLTGVEARYPDGDGDLFGRSNAGVVSCTPPADWTTVGGDCADNDDTIHPGLYDAPYDDVDRDCSGSDWDWDGDGVEADLPEHPSGTDCDDTAPWVFPGAPDRCDGHDDSCGENPWAPEDERGAFFEGDAAFAFDDGGEPNMSGVRAYSDLSVPLGAGDVVTPPGSGTVWLCEDRNWQGTIFANLSSRLTVASPDGQRATLSHPLHSGVAISVTACYDFTVTNLDVDGQIQSVNSATTLDAVDVTGQLGAGVPLVYQSYGRLTVAHSTLHDTEWSPVYTQDAPFVAFVDAELVEVGFGLILDGGNAGTLSLDGVSIRQVGDGDSIAVGGFDEVLLDTVEFRGHPNGYALRVTTPGTTHVEATNVDFGTTTEDVWFQSAHNYTANPASFDCDARACTP